MEGLTFIFNCDLLSPPKGTYTVEPSVEKMIAAGEDIRRVRLSTCKDGEDVVKPYRIEMFADQGTAFFDDKVDMKGAHHANMEVSLLPGENIVSALVQTDG